VALIDALAVALFHDRPKLDRDLGALVGSRCDACGAVSWPSRAVCYRCGVSPMRETVFSSAGSLTTFTTVSVPSPGLDSPYSIGQILIDNGPLVFSHVRKLGANCLVPLRVRLHLSEDATGVPLFWFEPDEEGGQ
jgi:uncharacterized OB-fold protein